MFCSRLLRSWIARSIRPLPLRASRSGQFLRRSQFRPRLAVLEDRTVPAVFTVTNTLDDGSAGSLRWAINQVNSDIDPVSTIDFNISGTGMQTIYLDSTLPTITHPVIINGGSQTAGFSANTLPNQGTGAGDDAVWTIALDGSNMNGQADGLTIAAGDSTVQGLVIQNFDNGIHLTTTGDDTIAGNYFTNNSTDIFVDSVADNTIGGTMPAARNLCTDNVTIEGAGATGNLLEGSYIGTNGNIVLAQEVAVFIWDASDNMVGGTSPGAGNVIATSFGRGIEIGGDGGGLLATGNLVQGN